MSGPGDRGPLCAAALDRPWDSIHKASRNLLSRLALLKLGNKDLNLD